MSSTSRNPRVSVVITCYNYARYLAQSIESVLSQTYQDYEIIVVNDGSTDDTDEVVSGYLSDSRIQYISQANMGQAGAKNAGIERSTGECVAFLDADDFWHKDKLEKQLPLLSNEKVGVVYTVAQHVDEIGRHVNSKPTRKYLRPKSGFVYKDLLFDNFVPFSSSIVRKRCLEVCGLFDETLSMGIDWDLWLRISPRYEFCYVDEALLFYRVGHTGQMSKNIEERQRCSDRIMARFIERSRSLLKPHWIRKAWAYTCVNRGYYFRNIDLSISSRYYFDSMKQNPLQIKAYAGLLKNAFKHFDHCVAPRKLPAKNLEKGCEKGHGVDRDAMCE
jgi:glycosyltransferase involved in cell wall biosynthesis